MAVRPCGAGDSIASYCLYLYHLALGETDLASLWREQTGIDIQPDIANVPLACDTEYAFDSSMPTVLRVLGHLITAQADRPRTDVFDAVMDYVPCAVTIGYLDPDPEIIDVPPVARAGLRRPHRGHPVRDDRTSCRLRAAAAAARSIAQAPPPTAGRIRHASRAARPCPRGGTVARAARGRAPLTRAALRLRGDAGSDLPR